MRIIAGNLKGLSFNAPKNNKITHPMSDKMRGALFNILGDISGLTIWDAFGGSGAVAFEAISHDAKEAFITEPNLIAVKTIKNNIGILSLKGKVNVAKANAVTWSQNHPLIQFDIVICDPPYKKANDIQLDVLRQNVKAGGFYILSIPPEHVRQEFINFTKEIDKNYGDGNLVFYRRKI